MAKFLSKNGKFYMQNGKLLQKATPLTWLINETPTIPVNSGGLTCTFYFSQISTTTTYTAFRFLQGQIFAGNTPIYNSIQKTWIDEKYRLVTFTEEPDDITLTWFEVNAKPIKNTVSKTWVINESPNTQSVTFPTTTYLWKQTINFTSNNIQFTSIEIIDGVDELYYGGISGVTTYSEGTWDNQAYRTVVFETTPTGELLTWLQANAVPQ